MPGVAATLVSVAVIGALGMWWQSLTSPFTPPEVDEKIWLLTAEKDYEISLSLHVHELDDGSTELGYDISADYAAEDLTYLLLLSGGAFEDIKLTFPRSEDTCGDSILGYCRWVELGDSDGLPASMNPGRYLVAVGELNNVDERFVWGSGKVIVDNPDWIVQSGKRTFFALPGFSMVSNWNPESPLGDTWDGLRLTLPEANLAHAFQGELVLHRPEVEKNTLSYRKLRLDERVEAVSPPLLTSDWLRWDSNPGWLPVSASGSIVSVTEEEEIANSIFIIGVLAGLVPTFWSASFLLVRFALNARSTERVVF